MRKFALGLGCAALLSTAGTSHAALGVLFSEDFEGYANTSAMEAVWAGVGTLGSLDTTQGSDGIGGSAGQSAFHGGGPVNEVRFSSLPNVPNNLLPTTDEWVKLSVDIFDWADPNPLFIDPQTTPNEPEFLNNPDNKRLTLGMRFFNDNPFNQITENIIELGHWNSTDGFPPNSPVPHFAHRSVIFAGAGTEPNWASWDMGLTGTPPDEIEVNSFQGGGGMAWHRWTVYVGPTTQVFEFDIDMDGTADFTQVYQDLEPTASGFDRLRFGGPSGVASGGGGGNIDNIVLELVAPLVINPGLEGDLDGDGFVGIADLNLILGNWNQNVTPGDLLSGDPSGDGFVGIDDLNVVLGNWNAGTPPASVVPEPATLALLGLGGVAMLQRRR